MYIVIGWPEIQDYMEEDWFEDEAILDVDSKIGDSTYLIPRERVLDNDLIKQEVEELISKFKISEEDIKAYKWEHSQAIPYEGGINVHEAIVQLYMQNFNKEN